MGNALCHFYETQQDLLDTLVPYFKAGLDNKEFCMWVISEPLTEETAREALRAALPDIDRHFLVGDMEIVSYRNWYLGDGSFSLQKTLDGWKEKVEKALAKGYPGIRVTGNTAWVPKNRWKDFAAYEKAVDESICDLRMTALCAYALDTSGSAQVLDAVCTHQFALAKRNGELEVIETSATRKAKAEIERLNEELERRVIERTAELATANEELRREFVQRTRAEEALSASEIAGRVIIESESEFVKSVAPDCILLDMNPAGLAMVEADCREQVIQQYESLVNAIDGIVWELDVQTFRFTFVSKQAARILGYPIEQWHNEPDFWTGHIHADDRERARDFCLKASARREDHQFEYRMIAADGRVVWLRDNVTVSNMADGSVRLRGVMVDITERKQAEDDLIRQKEILEKIFDHLPVMINFTGSDGRVKLVNREWQKTLGWSQEEVLRQDLDVFAECYPDPKYRQEVANFIRAAHGDWVDFKTRVRDGSVIDTTWARVELSDGTTIGIGRDTTAHKRAEEALRESEERYRDLVEHSRDLICTHDLEGRLLSANRTAEKLLGYDLKGLGEKNFREILAPEVRDQFDDYLARIREHGVASGTMLVQTSTGERRVWEYHNTLRTDGVDKPIVRGMARDITEARRVQEALRTSERKFPGDL